MDSLPYCICFDGLYENTIKEYIDKYKNTGYNISLRNFCYPIRKDRNIKLTNDEEKFNHILGGLRSKIESYFAELGSIFTRFSGQCKIRITDKKIYNIQLKLAIVLLNIKYFNDLFQIEDNNHYNKWRLENFDYSYSENRELNSDISLKTVFKIDEINDIKNLQLNFLNNLTIDNDDIAESFMNIDDNLDDTNLQSNSYEIQYIIKHKKLFDKYEYLVKWRNYGKEHNSWVKECDFNEIDTIREYWTSISRKNIEQSSIEPLNIFQSRKLFCNTGSLPETDEFSVESAPVESAPVESAPVSPVPTAVFTFTCPVIPSELDPTNNATIPTAATENQFRFTSVPGVTQFSKGGNVEPELRDSSEDMPEFIVKWNSNKRKRFRPVTPSTSRSPKKRRTGVTEFKPRVT
ncbi:hypothetical protein MFLAVUS_006628 [Mucor flavus]|uniref:Chromo domain-containing protein n=1 Tax=Mucor flavus TaxID=439312 RepID=A0ABP9Z222_9FUNG